MFKLRALVPYALLVGAFSVDADQANARVQPANAGVSSFEVNGDKDCFSWYYSWDATTLGMRNDCDIVDQWWSMPLIWDSPALFGPKTVKVAAARTANNALHCIAVTYNNVGAYVSEIAFPAFANSGRSTSQINIPLVPIGGFTTIECELPKGQTSRLQSVEYTP